MSILAALLAVAAIMPMHNVLSRGYGRLSSRGQACAMQMLSPEMSRRPSAFARPAAVAKICAGGGACAGEVDIARGWSHDVQLRLTRSPLAMYVCPFGPDRSRR
jgi:hypothetical protein